MLTRAGDTFVDAAKSYVAFMLDKGIPSTFHNVKHLYSDATKKDVLASIVSEYLDAQAKGNTNGAANGDESKGETAALYYLAQHYNYRLSRDLAKAMEYIDKAIERIPDSVDFHMTKARIWKHIGNVSKAAEIMDKARSLDTKDRYINTKAAKYQLRNNENDKALKTMGLFTRADTPGGPISDLLDMQCLWYLTEDGEAFARVGNTAMALKRFHQVHDIFEVWHDDQFDFHSFFLRKGQARAYVDMIRWEDRLHEHPFYSQAALDAVQLYLAMHDAAAGGGANGAEGANGEDDAEKRKAARKARKEQQRLEREAAEQASKQDPNKPVPVDAEGKKKDDDPHGLKLAATTEPLKEAMAFVEPLLKYSPKSLAAQLAGFDVHLRRSKFFRLSSPSSHPQDDLLIRSTEKYLLAMQCLNSALALEASNPKVHERSVQFRQVVSPELASLPETTAQVLKSEFAPLAEGGDLQKVNDEYLETNKGSARCVHSGIRVRRMLGGDRAGCEGELVKLAGMEGLELGDALEVLGTLKEWGSAQVGAFKEGAKARWPEASGFV